MEQSPLNSNRAFGLVEVLIAMGLVAMLALGLVSTLSNAGKAQRGIQAKDIQREIMGEISSHLSDKAACLNTLGGSNPYVPFTKAAIKDAVNANKYVVGTNHKSNLVMYTEFKVVDWVVDAGAPGQGRANLAVTLTKLGDVNGVKEIHQSLGLRLKLNGANNIIECFSVGTNSDSFWKSSAVNVSDIYYSGGNVGIGTATPAAMLDVAGGIRPGSEAQVVICNAAREGTQRYNYTKHEMEYCGGSPLGWVSASGGYVRGGIYGGCYQQKDAAFNAVYGGFSAWPVTSCPAAGGAFPTCAPGFSVVILSSSQGNSAVSFQQWGFLDVDVYFSSWACSKD